MRVVLTPKAVEDIEQAHGYYSSVDPDLGAQFKLALDSSIERIIMFPRGATPVDGFDGIRRARMRRFPYGVFYLEPTGNELVLLRVLHSRRQRDEALGG